MSPPVDNDYELVATVRVMRCQRPREHAVHVDFSQLHGEARSGFATVDYAMHVATELIIAELASEDVTPHSQPKAFVP